MSEMEAYLRDQIDRDLKRASAALAMYPPEDRPWAHRRLIAEHLEHTVYLRKLLVSIGHAEPAPLLSYPLPQADAALK